MMRKNLSYVWPVLILFTYAFGSETAAQAQAQAPATSSVLSSEELGTGVTLNVLELKRRGTRAIKLKFEIVNKSDALVGPWTYGMGKTWLNTGTAKHMFELGDLALVDFDNGKKYKVVRDSKGTCVCSRGTNASATVNPGKVKAYWAQFAAPPAEVTKITIEIPGAPPIDDVPISK